MIKRTTLAVAISSLLLGGCGGSSSPTPAAKPLPVLPVAPAEQGQLIGTAATGAPIKGKLTLRAVDGASTEYTVQEQGAFAFDSVADLKTPALLKMVGGSGGQAHELYSVVLKEQLAAGVVNVTPLTQLLISHATGAAASKVFETPENYSDSLTKENLALAQTELKQVLAKLFEAAGVETDFDLLSSKFQANYTKADAVLDLLDIQFLDDQLQATVTYRAKSEYSVTLTYGQSWTESLLPDSVTVEEAAESLGYLVTADSILESMVLEQNQQDYMAYVHPNASWFGESDTGLWQYKKRTMGNEIDTGMDRYRDLSLVSVDSANQRFEISFTQRLEDSQFASGSRMHAWFEKDSDGKFKFLGEETQLPIHASLFLKLESYDTADKEFAENAWRMEVDAFPSQAACDMFTASPNGWEWGNSDFSSKLEDINKHINLDYVTITGPGFDKPFKLDKVFKMENKAEGALASCHLASSEYQFSPVLTGYTFDYDPMSEAKAPIPDNSVYTISYYRNNESKPFFERKINAGKGISPMSEMMPFMARKTELSLNAGEFKYAWRRDSDLVTDADLWIYARYNHKGAGFRASIEDGKTEVFRSKLPDVGNVYHSSYDPYGRVITRGYLYPYPE